LSRADGRLPAQIRPTNITPNYLRHAEGSALIRMGETVVVCAATIEESVPPFLKGTGKGWITAEYGMLPRSSGQRIPRDGRRGTLSGRTQEIQRLIGRSLRAAFDLDAIGERSILIDCDVIEADGGTRTASITASFVAVYDAIRWLKDKEKISSDPMLDYVAAISVGMKDGQALLDLCYTEDSSADVDMNVVMTGSGRLVEIQGTAEHRPFSREDLDTMLTLGVAGIETLITLQKKALGIV